MMGRAHGCAGLATHLAEDEDGDEVPVDQQLDDELDAAAAKLQAMQRGKLARKDLRDQQDAAKKLQAMQRGRQGRGVAKQYRQEGEAATRVQAIQRGRQQRRQLSKERAAAAKD